MKMGFRVREFLSGKNPRLDRLFLANSLPAICEAGVTSSFSFPAQPFRSSIRANGPVIYWPYEKGFASTSSSGRVQKGIGK
jgi:hypothetical protein